MNPKVKQSLFVFGVICFTATILWSVRTESSEPLGDDSDMPLVETGKESTKTGKPFWSQLNIKTSVEKRDEARSLRQIELAQMINRLQGVSNTLVVLSDNEVVGIGIPKRPMTACVSVDPTHGRLQTTTIDAVRKLVSGATSGLSVDQVTVIDNLTGTDANNTTNSSFDTVLLREKIEQALGLHIATVTVTPAKTSAFERAIPWLIPIPSVRITLPASWIAKRTEQVGSEAIVLKSLRTIVSSIIPDANPTFHIVQDSPIVHTNLSGQESYAKLVVVIVGLLAIMISGFVVDYRRRPTESVASMHFGNPREEANRILEMDHSSAKHAIDNLYGSYKIKVLQEIVHAEDTAEETPIIQVQKQHELELA